jgi:hypothetical protein
MMDLLPYEGEFVEEPQDVLPPPEPRCRRCGCSESEPCEGGCWWVEGEVPPVCSRCIVLEVLQR